MSEIQKSISVFTIFNTDPEKPLDDSNPGVEDAKNPTK